MVHGRRKYTASACRGDVSRQDKSPSQEYCYCLELDMEVWRYGIRVRYYLLRQMTSVGVAGVGGGRGCVDVGSTGVVIGVGTAPAADVSAADGLEALGFFLVMIQVARRYLSWPD